MKTGLWSFRT